ncbi:MAG: CHAD domain-containing protein, partial [Acidobacteriaceae bacterium]|nr:CHAD domain-containing protein [Acidobacteriaceae bacterium]
PENYHYFRRRVKDHWYHVRLLESVWTEVMQAHEASLKKLETWLGDDHNLVVLCQQLHTEPEKFGDGNTAQLFTSLAEQYQKELRENATSFGERAYEQKPREFVNNMAKLWQDWQKQPDSAKIVEQEQRQAAKKQPGHQASKASNTAVA